MLAVVLQILKCHAHTLKKSAQVFLCRVSHDKKEKKRDRHFKKRFICEHFASRNAHLFADNRLRSGMLPPNFGNFWDCLAKKRIKAKWKRKLKSRLQNTSPHSSLNSPTHKHTLSLTDTLSLSHSPCLSHSESKCYSARSSEFQKKKPLSSQAPLLLFHSEIAVNCSFISPNTIFKSSEQTKKLYAETITELHQRIQFCWIDLSIPFCLFFVVVEGILWGIS
jgi:hypothetical protein